ncbi:iron-siderophore ABC transporter substrate-binding protein [Streptomyces armeniacus]|uniref:Iron-siderophore ABC transporter substrate-binding protein n=1 Tax=Streptomyces armeniacus TaxID=83291 RepID=A0A345XWC7_9ACTN|nr:iron-siderophore ABC transporter substrate-binding protein [Streptomyces armeniacus]AXK35943.1 iron-siderophore ABC transporter substrate-binding protein [Streptomyces armeniacus]
MLIRTHGTRRRTRAAAVVALPLAAVLTLTACGSSDSGGGKSKGGSGGKDKVAQGGEEFAEAARKTASFGSDAKPGEWPRTVTHAMGETEIEERPKRVVVLDVGEFDNAVSLGVKPVGLAPTEGDNAVPSYLEDQAGKPKSVGTINNLNLEAIAALKPDLILGTQLRAADKYEQLSQIAPTVFGIRPGFTWKENYLLNASALGRKPQAQAKLAAYEKKAAQLGKDIAEKSEDGKKPTVSMVRYMPDTIRLYAGASFIGTILKDTGLPRPKNQQVYDLATEISPERMDEADADWIFTGAYGDPKATDRDKAQDSPLWKNLGAVKAGQAEDVDDETWYLGLGVTAAERVLGDLRRHLVK